MAIELLIRGSVLTIALVLAGCASLLDDSDMKRMENQEVSFDCAMKLMRQTEYPVSIPWVMEVDGMWWNTYYTSQKLTRSEYDDNLNVIWIFPTMHYYAEDLLHENIHAIQYFIGEEYGENEARKHTYWLKHCFLFDEL